MVAPATPTGTPAAFSAARGPIGALRLALIYLRVVALNELQYRANFVIQIFQSGIALFTGLAVLGLVFSHTAELNGWSSAELLALMGVHILMGGIIGAAIQPNMERLLDDVRQGTLDFILTKPADAQVLVSVRDFRIWRAVDIVIGAIVVIIGIVRLGSAVGILGGLAFGVAIVLGATMIYCFWMLITTAAFWIVRMDEVHDLFDGLYQAGRWPVTIYPGWLRIGLTFLVPIAFAVTVPAQALTSRLDPGTLALAAAFAALLGLITRGFWKLGLRRYSGASA